jgi:hypothetical protein
MKRLFCVLSIIQAILTGSDIEWDWDAAACPPDRFFATVGHYNMTSKNYKELLRRNPRLLVVVSSSACRECCPFEDTLHEMNVKYFSNSTVNHNLSIKIARVDLVYEPWYLSTYPSATVPDVQYFKDGAEQSITDKMDGNLIMEQIIRLEKWYTEILSTEALFDFLDPRIDQPGYKRKRLLCVVPDSQNMEEFDRISQSTYWRADIKYGLIRDLGLIEKIVSSDLKISKADLKTSKRLNLNLRTFGIDSLSANRIYLISFKNQLEDSHKSYMYNPETDGEMDHWFMFRSTEPVEEFTKYNQHFLNIRSQVTLFAFVDVTDKPKSTRFIDELSKLAQSMPEHNFVWVDWDSRRKIAMTTGVFHCPERPCLSLAMKSDDDKVPHENTVALARTYQNYQLMPPHFSKTFNGLHEFMIMVLAGSSVLTPGLDAHGQKAYANYRVFHTNFAMKTLSNIHLKDEVLRNDKDYIVFFVESYSDFDQQVLFNRYYAIKNFFKKVANMDPLLFIYDFSTESSLPDLKVKTLDTFVITRELKSQKKPGVVCTEAASTTVGIVVEYLKTKDVKLDKSIVFSDDDRSAGITYQAIFEGQF